MGMELNVVRVKVDNEAELGYVISNRGRLSLFNALGELVSKDDMSRLSLCNALGELASKDTYECGSSFKKRADIFFAPRAGSIMDRAAIMSLGLQVNDEAINLTTEKRGLITSAIRPAICTYDNVKIPCILMLSYEYGTDILKYGAEISGMFSMDGREVSKSFYEGEEKNFTISKNISDTVLDSMRCTMQYVQSN